LGAFLLIGMGADSLSVAPSSLAEIKKVIRAVSREDAAQAAAEALAAPTAEIVIAGLTERLGKVLDLGKFNGSWNLSAAD
ncbi:MAG TPA: hypothetical protein VFZ20_04010, partial [Longimicrobium sp.]